jgi:hypothetical protein
MFNNCLIKYESRCFLVPAGGIPFQFFPRAGSLNIGHMGLAVPICYLKEITITLKKRPDAQCGKYARGRLLFVRPRLVRPALASPYSRPFDIPLLQAWTIIRVRMAGLRLADRSGAFFPPITGHM